MIFFSLLVLAYKTNNNTIYGSGLELDRDHSECRFQVTNVKSEFRGQGRSFCLDTLDYKLLELERGKERETRVEREREGRLFKSSIDHVMEGWPVEMVKTYPNIPTKCLNVSGLMRLFLFDFLCMKCGVEVSSLDH